LRARKSFDTKDTGPDIQPVTLERVEAKAGRGDVNGHPTMAVADDAQNLKNVTIEVAMIHSTEILPTRIDLLERHRVRNPAFFLQSDDRGAPKSDQAFG
jgi:hypothetical protein